MEHWHRSGQALLNEISSTRLPASQLAVWSIGQCGFIFKYEDTVVCIDPVLSDLTGPSGSRRCYPAPFAPAISSHRLKSVSCLIFEIFIPLIASALLSSVCLSALALRSF